MGGLSFPHIIEGDGERTIIFIPGLLGDTSSFEEVARFFLNDGWKVIRVSYPEEPFTLPDFARALIELIDGKATVVGTSMGGYTAQLMAVMEPGKIENLVLVNTFPSAKKIMGGARWLVKLLRFLPKKLIKRQMEKGITDAHLGGSERVREKVLGFLRNAPADILYYRLDALADAPEINDFPRGLKTIIFFTKGDPTIPENLKEELVEKAKPHIVYEFEEGGHFPYLHNPEKFYRILKSALEGGDR